MQASKDSVDSKLLKPTIIHGPILGPQKGVPELKQHILRNRMLQGTVVQVSDVVYEPFCFSNNSVDAFTVQQMLAKLSHKLKHCTS